MQVNFSSPSFGSTYKFDLRNKDLVTSLVTTDSVADYCYDNNCYCQVQREIPNSSKNPKVGMVSQISAVIPDDMDYDFENYCYQLGIKFDRYTDEHLSQDRIIKRTELSEYATRDMEIHLLNADKFEELLKNQPNNNIQHCQNMYEQYYKEKADGMIKSNLPIEPTNLYIIPAFEGVKEYVERYGVENLNYDSICLDFNQLDEFDHCNYFAMRNLGMNDIPVCVDSNTYEIGKVLGLFE